MPFNSLHFAFTRSFFYEEIEKSSCGVTRKIGGFYYLIVPILCCSLAPVQLQPVAHQHAPSPSVLHPPTTGIVIAIQQRVPLLASPLVIHPVPLGMRRLQVPLHLKLKHAQLPVMQQLLVQLVA